MHVLSIEIDPLQVLLAKFASLKALGSLNDLKTLVLGHSKPWGVRIIFHGSFPTSMAEPMVILLID